MNKRMLFSASLLALFALILTFGIALAHTTVHVGNYDIEVGWVNEPPVIGQRNAVVVNVSDTTATDKAVDVSKLTVNVNYGGQTKTLELQPLSEDTSNQYIAPILPTIAGQYSIHLGGKLDDTDVNVDVQPEEVVSSDTLAFPSAAAGSQGQGQRGGGFGGGGFNGGFGLTTWLSGGALLVAVVALVLGIVAMRKPRS